MQLREVRDIFRKELAARYPPEEVDAIFYRTLEHFLDLPRFVLGLEPAKVLTRDEEAPMFRALAGLAEGRPIQYITGIARFMDLDVAVGPGVLIPRPETEELVRWVLECHAADLPGGRVLDIGTGSGCIALGLAKNLPETAVFGLDLSDDAIGIAQGNARQLGLNVKFLREDILRPSGEWQEFNLIVSNPPYIPQGHRDSLDGHVIDHEPREALFVPDNDPLLFYRHIGGFAQKHLVAGGWLYVETHAEFGEQTAALFRSQGFREVLLKKDIFGKDRFVCGQKSGLTQTE